MNTLKIFLLRLLAVCLVLGSPLAQATDFPTHPVTLVVPFAPGGFVHLVALMMSDSMSSLLGQPVVISNQPGANGMLAAKSVARATPDGYTVLLTTASILTINPHLYKSIQLDPLADFAPVGEIVNTSNIFVVSSSSGIKTFKDLVDRARTKPQAVSYGSTGVGSLQHIAGEALQQQAGVQLLHVPYKGISPALTDLIGGNVTFVFSDASSIPYITGGRLTALAVSPRALEQLPSVPVLADVVAGAGVPNYTVPTLWYGIVAPQGTPKDVIARLNAAIAQSLAKPEIRQKLLASGATPAENTSSEFLGEAIKSDYERYGAMLKTLNIHIE